MAMTIPAGRVRPLPYRLHLDGLIAAWFAHRERQAARAALSRAGRLGPRLLADMGIDAETARAAAEGWDALPVNGLLVRGRR